MCRLGGILLCLGLCYASLRLHQSRICGCPRISSAVEIRPRDQAVLEQALCALPVHLIAVVVSLGALQIGLRSLQRGIGRQFISLRRLQRCFVGIYIGRGLNVLQLRQQLTLLHVIALFHVQVGDLPESVGSDVDVILRFDFTRSADHRCQIQPLHLSGLDSGYVFAALMNGKADNDCE